jgi:hypothetical protein
MVGVLLGVNVGVSTGVLVGVLLGVKVTVLDGVMVGETDGGIGVLLNFVTIIPGVNDCVNAGTGETSRQMGVESTFPYGVRVLPCSS